MARRNPIFRNMDRLEESLARPRYDRRTRKPLTHDDYSDFERAGNIRRGQRATPRTIVEARRQLKKDNAVRYWRLKHDVKWARKRMTKMGRRPDDLWTVLNG